VAEYPIFLLIFWLLLVLVAVDFLAVVVLVDIELLLAHQAVADLLKAKLLLQEQQITQLQLALVALEIQLQVLVVMVLIPFFQLLPQQAVVAVRLTMGREGLEAVVVAAQKIQVQVVLEPLTKAVLVEQAQAMWMKALAVAVVVLVPLAQTEAQILRQMLAAMELHHLSQVRL
jgi:hypothetical protein